MTRETEMTNQLIRKKLTLSAFVLAVALFSAPRSSAQAMPANPTPAPAPADKPAAPATAAAPAAAPKIDPQEEADYKAFTDLKADDDDKHIALGDAFVQKYPNGRYTEAVYSQLTTSEYNKHDFAKMYADGDKALALNPDDVSVLVVVGFVIPHTYNPNDVDGDAKLDKAEKYEKHALATLATLPKPAGMSDDQFAKAKALAESQAHSGLGLIYFRKANYEGAVAELKIGTSTATPPDPTDYYVMGVSLGKLDRNAEAADAYTKCAAIPGGLQAKCKQDADEAKKLPATKPAPAKP
jgi:tetratricopeptide (TPR) repeat protein